MYGWRGRLGLILPADNAVVEVDVASRLPEGVSSLVVRLSSGDKRDEMPVEGVKFAAYLTEADASIVGYMCAASSYLLGVKGNEELCAKMSESTGGLPSFTASTAMTDALAHLGAKSVSVLTPHPPHIAKYLSDYLGEAGFEVSQLTALNMGLREINSQYPGDVYRAATAIDHDGADAIFIAATNFRAMEIIPMLEKKYGVPVITSNQVSLWAGLRGMGVPDSIPNLGRLLA
jgi:maleate cis-trans isomerase